MKNHGYSLSVKWTGNMGTGTSHYTEFERSFIINAPGKSEILGSSDPSFRGDKTKYNPEELLLASISSCHMLWYLHLCAVEGIIIIDYFDQATGTMRESENGAGRFTEVILHPMIWLSDIGMKDIAHKLHPKAHEFCFIANSLNFPVLHKATYKFSH